MWKRLGLMFALGLAFSACYDGSEEDTSGGGTENSGNSGASLTCDNANEMWCAGSCTDIMTSADHCGGCDNDCGPASTCQGGVCTGICPGGQQLCGGECIDPETDRNNCGDCFNDCGDAQCVGGFCDFCSGEETLCGGECPNLADNYFHCGECFNQCEDGQECVAGSCVMAMDTDAPMTTGPGDSGDSTTGGGMMSAGSGDTGGSSSTGM